MAMAGKEDPAVDVLRAAIAMEAEGKDLFERASRSMTHPRARDMFLSLARQEQVHIQVLDHELGRLEQGLSWSRLEDAKQGAARHPDSPVFKAGEVRRLTPGPDAGELEVVDLGIEVEKKSIEYYRAAGLRCDDPAAKEVFSWLVGQEAGHLTILQAERDSRSGSGFYYDDMEFSLEVE